MEDISKYLISDEIDVLSRNLKYASMLYSHELLDVGDDDSIKVYNDDVSEEVKLVFDGDVKNSLLLNNLSYSNELINIYSKKFRERDIVHRIMSLIKNFSEENLKFDSEYDILCRIYSIYKYVRLLDKSLVEEHSKLYIDYIISIECSVDEIVDRNYNYKKWLSILYKSIRSKINPSDSKIYRFYRKCVNCNKIVKSGIMDNSNLNLLLINSLGRNDAIEFLLKLKYIMI